MLNSTIFIAAFCFSEIRDGFQNPLITVSHDETEVANTDGNSDVVCAYYPGRPDDVQRFDCSSVMLGRHVRVTLLNVTTILSVYEINVIGPI